jgi:predicted lipid-binding transport protein (Tim44 family)
MKAIFGVMALLLVLAIVGSIAKKQLQAIGPNQAARAAAIDASAPSFAADPDAATVGARARSMQERARAETARALEQGVQRNERADP